MCSQFLGEETQELLHKLVVVLIFTPSLNTQLLFICSPCPQRTKEVRNKKEQQEQPPNNEQNDNEYISSVQFSSVAQLCLTLCDPMDCSTPGLPVHHELPEFTQSHVH